MRFVITAGPTREYLDAVRFLSNPSTGKMGFAVAEAAARAGHEVVLVAGPVQLKTPPKVVRVDVTSACEMMQAVKESLTPDSVLVATAAVADFRPKAQAKRKLHKTEMPRTIELTPNPDILARAKCRFKVGFAAETDDLIKSAASKCARKHLDMIVANDVTRPGAGFATDTNEATFLFPDGHEERQPLMAKKRLARKIIERISQWS